MDAKGAKQRFQEADGLFRQGQYEEALSALQQLDRESPNQKHILYAAAKCLEKMGSIEEAKLLCYQMIRTFDYQKAQELLNHLEVAPRIAVKPLEDDAEDVARKNNRPIRREVIPQKNRRITGAVLGGLAVLGYVAVMLTFPGLSEEESPGAVHSGFLLASLLFAGTLSYIFFCYLGKCICENADTRPGLLIWVPVLSIIPMMRAARMPFLWLLINFVPFVGGLIFIVVFGFKLCSACGKQPALGLLFAVPVVNLGLLLYLAFFPSEDDIYAPASPGRARTAPRPPSVQEHVPSAASSSGRKNATMYLAIGAAALLLTFLILPFLMTRGRDKIPEEIITVTVSLPGNVSLELVRIPAGTFMMGRYPGEADSLPGEDPRRRVRIVNPFWMGKYEITQAQWEALMETWPEYPPIADLGLGEAHPAYNISWLDAKAFIAALNTRIEETGQGPLKVRLPSEAEWEYACRAGTQTRFYWGDDDEYTQIEAYAWYSGNLSPSAVQPVGGKLPNAFGLYDMSGNVYEWCEDDHYPDYTGASDDSRARMATPRRPRRVIRGGSAYIIAHRCRSAERYGHNAPQDRIPYIGFRLAAD